MRLLWRPHVVQDSSLYGFGFGAQGGWDPCPTLGSNPQASGATCRHPRLTTLPCLPCCQVLKRQGYDEGCDIWSLGILLYTMLAG